ncbi:MAG: hypothetical protein ACOYN6_10380 [Ignavibacteria bacterium]
MELIREENFLISNKQYTIKVEFDGDNYIVSGYLEGNLVNQTKRSAPGNSETYKSDSIEIENLIYLIKEDFKENEL